MIKTEFMELYEELNNINEAIADIDLEAIRPAYTAAQQLRREVWDLERELNNKLISAYNAKDEYVKLCKEHDELSRKRRELSQKYWVRTWFTDSDGNPEHDDEFLSDEYEKVKDQVEELDRLMKDISDKLEMIKAEVNTQFSSDAEAIKNKKAEITANDTKHKDLTTKLNQAYPEVKEEIDKIVAMLNDPDGDYEYGHAEGWKAIEKISYEAGRLVVTLYTELINDYVDFLDEDDFDSSGDLRERTEKWVADDLVADNGARAEDIVADYNLESTEEGWYKIPGSDWELCKESDYDVTEVPELVYDRYNEGYEADGQFSVSAYLYVGKKVKK
jgi:hypothetical protein